MSAEAILQSVNLQVIELKANKRPTEEHMDWRVGIAPDADEDLAGRVVYGTLHSHGPEGGGDVTVAAIVRVYGEQSLLDADEFRDALNGSVALESLYDAARSALKVCLALVDAEIELDVESPTPTFGLLKRREPPDSDAESGESPDRQSGSTNDSASAPQLKPLE